MSVLSTAELYRLVWAERFGPAPDAHPVTDTARVMPWGAGRPEWYLWTHPGQRAEAIGLRRQRRWSPGQIARLLLVDESRVTRWLGQADLEVCEVCQ